MEKPRPGARSHAGEHSAAVGLSRRQVLVAAIAATATVGYSSARAIGGSSIAGRLSSGVSRAAQGSSDSAGPASTVPSTTAANTSVATTEPTPERFISEAVGDGMAGADVEAVQERLTELNFDPGPVDGIFGLLTKQAVWALEKLLFETPRTEMRGVVTPAMFEAISRDVLVSPRRNPPGTHMEVYLPEQVAVLFVDGQAAVISHVSSGEGIEWCDVVEVDTDDGGTEEQGICGISITPGGVYEFNRRVDGWRNAKLGRLFKPVYFNYGIAIHGASQVPAFPASRGCVRFPIHVADYIPDLIELGDAIYVFDGVEEPETYGAQPMIFDYPDPNWEPPADQLDDDAVVGDELTPVDPEPAEATGTEPAVPPTTQPATTQTPAADPALPDRGDVDPASAPPEAGSAPADSTG